MTLPQYLRSCADKQFKWGVHDCVLFTVGWIESIHGRKYLPDITWFNERQAMRVLKTYGGLAAAFDKKLVRIEPNFAKDGDVAVIGTRSYIFSGSHIVGVGSSGLTFRSRLEAEHAFHV